MLKRLEEQEKIARKTDKPYVCDIFDLYRRVEEDACKRFKNFFQYQLIRPYKPIISNAKDIKSNAVALLNTLLYFFDVVDDIADIDIIVEIYEKLQEIQKRICDHCGVEYFEKLEEEQKIEIKGCSK